MINTTTIDAATVESAFDDLTLRMSKAKAITLLLLGTLDANEDTVDIPALTFADALHAVHDLLDITQ